MPSILSLTTLKTLLWFMPVLTFSSLTARFFKFVLSVLLLHVIKRKVKVNRAKTTLKELHKITSNQEV